MRIQAWSRSSAAVGWFLAGALGVFAGCQQCDDGSCQNVLQIELTKDVWELGEYRVLVSFDGRTFECVASLPGAEPASGDVCSEDPRVTLASGQPPVAPRPEFRSLVIRDATPDVVEMSWFLGDEEFTTVEVKPSYRKQTRDEYPRQCGKPCDVGDAEVALD